MILGIRSESADATVALYGDKIIDQIDWTAGRQLSDQLLTKIEELLSNNKLSWPDISGVVVYEGPGSFTGLRIGITVANTIAFVLKSPIVGATGEDWVEQGMHKLKSAKVGEIVVPEYGSEPNITRPKK